MGGRSLEARAVLVDIEEVTRKCVLYRTVEQFQLLPLSHLGGDHMQTVVYF